LPKHRVRINFKQSWLSNLPEFIIHSEEHKLLMDDKKRNFKRRKLNIQVIKNNSLQTITEGKKNYKDKYLHIINFKESVVEIPNSMIKREKSKVILNNSFCVKFCKHVH
jgi:hypothetical protein